MRHSLLTLLMLLGFAIAAHGQSPYRGSLKVNITPDAQAALSHINSKVTSDRISGYRVGIFFDNGPQARAHATEAKAQFQENFPSTSVYMTYESPYYKVAAGNCLTNEEAIILHERIKTVFPKAYIMREPMKLSNLTLDRSLVNGEFHVEHTDSLNL